jgi:hypothetical protein
MVTPSRFIFLALAVFTAAGLGTAGAEPASYPEKNPAFTFDVPKDWKAVFDNGALKIIPQSGDALVMFQSVTDVKDDAAAKNGLPVLAKQAAKTFSMENAEVAVQPMESEAGKFKAFMTAYKGKNKGDDSFWYLAMFAPTKGNYYLMTVVYDLKDEKKTADDRGAIQMSIRPVGAAPAASASPSATASASPKSETKKKGSDDNDADDDDDATTAGKKSAPGGLGAAIKPKK